MIQSLYILILTGITCSLLGVFLVLRKLSMVADAISHSVLLGIVLAFFLTYDLHSPLLLLGATLFGILTVIFIERLGKTGLVRYHDAIGVVFPILFSIAVIFISAFLRNSGLDTDIVLMGEVIFAPLNTIQIGTLLLPIAAVRLMVLLAVDLLFLFLCYRVLKVSTFDEEYAQLIGIPVGAIFYGLMTLTSLTTVVAFDAVGAILVLSFLITPAASAYLLARDLKGMLLLSAIFATLSATFGYYLAILWNVSMSGLCAVISTLLFSVLLFVHPNGWIAQTVRRRKNRRQLREELFLIHVGNHTHLQMQSAENAVSSIEEHLRWTKPELQKTVRFWMNQHAIVEDGAFYVLTEKGDQLFHNLCQQYGIQYPHAEAAHKEGTARTHTKK